MTLFSWLDEDLVEHSIGSMKIARERFTKELKVAVKLAEVATRSRASLGIKIPLLAIGLHDIGKAIAKYQESVRKAMENRCAKPSFYCHELISAYAFSKLISKPLLQISSEADRILVKASAQAIILGHHSMQRAQRCCSTLSKRMLEESSWRRFSSLDEVLELVRRVFDEAGVSVDERRLRSRLKSIERLLPSTSQFIITELARDYRAYRIALAIVAPLLLSDCEAAKKARS